MRTKHDSDAAFEAWVDGADQLRAHSVQAAFREGWNAGRAYEVHSGWHLKHKEIAQLKAELEQADAAADTAESVAQMAAHDRDEALENFAQLEAHPALGLTDNEWAIIYRLVSRYIFAAEKDHGGKDYPSKQVHVELIQKVMQAWNEVRGARD